MYLNLRRYPKIGVGKDVIEQSVESELLPELQEQAGFKGYCAFWDEEGAGASVSLFEDQEAAHRPRDLAGSGAGRGRGATVALRAGPGAGQRAGDAGHAGIRAAADAAHDHA